uniref:Uncharacterized protein n=1 Tax=Ixodes ricinus TaxID=34613 RepID=A0A6B0U3Z1_IXORI
MCEPAFWSLAIHITTVVGHKPIPEYSVLPRMSAEALIVPSRSRVLTQFSCPIHEPRSTVVRWVVSIPQLSHQALRRTD